MIFQNNSNKTNFGGVLTIFYIFIILIISAFYLLDYIAKDNYSIEYFKYTHDSNDFNQIDEDSNDERYDPYFNFLFEIYADDLEVPLSNNFKLLNFSNLINGKVSSIERGKP